MNYAIDYAPKGETNIAKFESDPSQTEFSSLTDTSERLAFLESLSAANTVFMELGGAGDVFALAAFRRGVSVRRIPTRHLKEIRVARGFKSDEQLKALLLAVAEKSEAFYLMRSVDAKVSAVKVAARAHWMIQRRLRVAAELRLQSVYRDEYLLDPRLPPKEKPEEPPARVDEDVFLKRALADSPVFKGLEAEEARWLRRVEAALADCEAWTEVFEPIAGIGPSIGGKLVGAISNINRFPSLSAFRAYAGYHHRSDGSRAQREAGKPSNWSPAFKQAIYLWTRVTLKTDPGKNPWRAKLDTRRAYELYKLLRDRGLLPSTWNKTYSDVRAVESGDLTLLLHHIDTLRSEANGEKPVLKGLKQMALAKASRWLGQKLIEHIWKEWQALEKRRANPSTPAVSAA